MDLPRIIYEDNHIIVADKPIGVLSQEDSSEDNDMLTLLKAYIKEKYQKPGEVFLGLVHRLDTVTSGVMVFARTSKAASRLSDSIRKDEFDKIYLCVVEGELEQKSGRYQDYLIKDSAKNIVSITKDKNKGKLAILEYEVISYHSDTNTSLLKIHLLTGRSHQIRVQFSSRGYAVAGDKKYGSKIELPRAIALHAYSLSFPHPTKKEILTFKSTPNRRPFTDFDIE